SATPAIRILCWTTSWWTGHWRSASRRRRSGTTCTTVRCRIIGPWSWTSARNDRTARLKRHAEIPGIPTVPQAGRRAFRYPFPSRGEPEVRVERAESARVRGLVGFERGWRRHEIGRAKTLGDTPPLAQVEL